MEGLLEWHVGTTIGGGQRAHMRFWHRPLSAMTDAFTTAGFRVDAIPEPPPAPEALELFPEQFAALSTTPTFVFFLLEAVGDPTGSVSAT